MSVGYLRENQVARMQRVKKRKKDCEQFQWKVSGCMCTIRLTNGSEVFFVVFFPVGTGEVYGVFCSRKENHAIQSRRVSPEKSL